MTIARIRPQSAMTGKTVLLRADLADGVSDELGRMAAFFSIAGARVAVIAGFGAPEGDINSALSLARFRSPLQRMSGRPVTFIPESVGPDAEAQLGRVPFGEIALMENLRFHPDERRDTRTFAIRLSALGDFFAISGAVPSKPIGWLAALATILPAPNSQLVASRRKDA